MGRNYDDYEWEREIDRMNREYDRDEARAKMREFMDGPGGDLVREGIRGGVGLAAKGVGSVIRGIGSLFRS